VIIKFLKWAIEIKKNENCDLNSETKTESREPDLERRVIAILKKAANQEEKLSIMQLCERTGIEDDHIMSSVIADLEVKGDVILDEFRKVYREDGGTIYLSLYSISPSVQH